MGTLQQHLMLGQLPVQEDLRHTDTHESAPPRLRELHAEYYPRVDGMLDLERYARPPRFYVGQRLDELLGKRWEKLLGKPRQFVTLLLTDAIQGPAMEMDYHYAQRLFDLTDRYAEEIERTGRLPEVIMSYLELLETYDQDKQAEAGGRVTDSGLLVPGASDKIVVRGGITAE